MTPLDMRLIHLHQLRFQIEYLYNPGSSSFEKIVKDSLFFYQCYNNAKGIFIIELCKLMNKGENHNIGKYIKSVCENYYSIIWSTPISLQELQGLQDRFDEINGSIQMIKVRNIRRKHVAHDDPKKLNWDLNLKFEDVFVILNQIVEIYNAISFHRSNVVFRFDYISKYTELQRLQAYSDTLAFLFEMLRDHKDVVSVKKIIELLSIR